MGFAHQRPEKRHAGGAVGGAGGCRRGQAISTAAMIAAIS
jgi:hypothetical protein